jgi:hypothetical protein
MRIADGRYREIPAKYSKHLHALVKGLLQIKVWLDRVL